MVHRFTASDGVAIEGVLLYPLDFVTGVPHPLVIVAHGGPESHYNNGWLTGYGTWGQLLSRKGFFVWFPNYRSSTGRGVAYAKDDHGDLAGTELEIQKLRNTIKPEKPVSMYGGIADAPMIVTREPPVRWFEDNEELTGGQLWAQLEAQLRGESKRVARQLRDNLFGPGLWRAMEPASRTFLTSAEAVFRSRIDDPGFDFSTVAIEYAKAVEVELNALIFPALRSLLSGRPPKQREIHGSHSRLDLGRPVRHQTMGAIAHYLEEAGLVRKGIWTALKHDAEWILSEEFNAVLGRLLKLRNPAAHWEVTMGDMVSEQRAELLGIGCEGFLVRLIQAKLRGEANQRA